MWGGGGASSNGIELRPTVAPSPGLSPNFGGEVTRAEGPESLVKAERKHRLRKRARILPLSSRSLRGEGAGGWGTADAAGYLSKRARILPSPRGTSGEGPGEGHLAGASSIPFVEPSIPFANPNLPQKTRIRWRFGRVRCGDGGIGVLKKFTMNTVMLACDGTTAGC